MPGAGKDGDGGPEIVKAVELPGLGLKNMDQHIVQIQKNPLGGGIPFHTQKFEVVPAAFLQQKVGQPPGLAR